MSSRSSKKVVRARIRSASAGSSLWYADLIGQEYPVVESELRDWYDVAMDHLNGTAGGRLIHVDDVELLTEQPEYTGGSVSYYKVQVANPTSGGDPYMAECNDIIEALGMNYAEGNAFKAIWRRCAARTLGKAKAGYKDGLYDAEKVVFFGQRMVAQEKSNNA